MIGAILREADAEISNEPLNVQRKNPSGCDEDEEKNDVLRGHAVRLRQCPFFASRTAWVNAGTTSSTSPTMP